MIRILFQLAICTTLVALCDHVGFTAPTFDIASESWWLQVVLVGFSSQAIVRLFSSAE